MERYYDIIKRPIITEESVDQMEENKYTFEVSKGANKTEIKKAIEHIFEELDGSEGLLVASKIADRGGITRSVIVNALRKLESAGVIESRSLGMKGTYIKVLNNKFLAALEEIKMR